MRFKSILTLVSILIYFIDDEDRNKRNENGICLSQRKK